MPDVFVAPDEKQTDGTIMHKRMPAPSESFPDPKPTVLVENPPAAPNPSPRNDQPITPPPSFSEDDQSSSKRLLFNPAIDLSIGSEERRNAIPLFASFWQNPHGVYFDTQEANEHILLFLRRHFITNLPWLFSSFLLVFVPLIIGYLFSFIHYPFPALSPIFVSAIVAMYYLFVFTNAYVHFLDWYYNISLITHKRVLDIELKDLVYKKISATKISLVQDINYVQTGTIRTLFNYGEVLIQTAGTQDNFYINSVPKPEVVVRIVEELIGKGREDKDNAIL